MILQDTYTLSNGVEIPKLGLGTWMIPNDAVGKAVQDAVALGYRHIDTAQAYANEAGVGDGLRACGVPRDRIFVTTKLAAEVKSYDEAVRSIDGSLKTLGLDTIDLMIIHSPQPWMQFGEPDRFFEGNREAWRALEDAYKEGKLRAIGVSNFLRVDLDNRGCSLVTLEGVRANAATSPPARSSLSTMIDPVGPVAPNTMLFIGRELPGTSMHVQL